MGEVSFAIIGSGNAGRHIHAPLISGTPGVHLAGIFSRDPERRREVATALGCRTWDSFADVLADPAIEVVVLATPTAEHVEQALAALAAGKHVVVDKPVCLDLAGLDRLATAERVAGRTLTAFHNRRWDGDFLTIRRLLAAGALGRLHAVELAWGAFGRPRGWRATTAGGGGRVFDLGTHMADQLCQFMPTPPRTVYARLQPPLPGQEVESHAHLVIGFADGATGVIETGYISAIAKPRFRLLGSLATFEKHGLDPQEAALRAGDVDAAREDPDNYGWLCDGATRSRVPTVPGRWRGLYEGLRDHLRAGAPNPVPLASLRPVVAILEAAFRSAASGTVAAVAG